MCSSDLVWEEVLSTLYDVRPIHFQYSTRQHTVDRDILQQVRRTSARVVIICDSGSGAEDRRVINTLIAQGYTPIVIDHHVYVGDYEQDRMVFKMYNSFEEIGLLGGAEVSGAYASLLVANHLCKIELARCRFSIDGLERFVNWLLANSSKNRYPDLDIVTELQ